MKNWQVVRFLLRISGWGYEFLFLHTHQCPSLCPVGFVSWISSTEVFGNWKEPPMTGRLASLQGTNSHLLLNGGFMCLGRWLDSQLVWYKLNVLMYSYLRNSMIIHESWVSSGMLLNHIDILYPIPSMYGIFTYIYQKKTQPNVGKYTLHGWYGYDQFDRNLYFFVYFDAAKTKRSPSKKPLSGDDNLARTATVQVGWDGVGGNLAMRLCWLEQIRMGTDSCLIVLPCFTMFCWFYHGLSMSYPYHPQ